MAVQGVGWARMLMHPSRSAPFCFSPNRFFEHLYPPEKRAEYAGSGKELAPGFYAYVNPYKAVKKGFLYALRKHMGG